MSDEEKKDNSAPWINYRTDHAEQQSAREQKSANEDTNKAKGQKQAEIGDAPGGKVKTRKEILKEGEERQGKGFAEKYVKEKTPQTRLLEVKEKKQIAGDKKNLHLKSTTALTDPETAKQNLKDASKAKNFGKENLPSRGGGFRGGGSPMMREPDEIIKEKHKTTNPEDILSQKKVDKPFEVAMNITSTTQPTQKKQESQPQQAQHKSSFMASLDAKIQKQVKKQEKEVSIKPAEKTKSETPKRSGIMAEIGKKVEAVKKTNAGKAESKSPKTKTVNPPPKPIIKGR